MYKVRLTPAARDDLKEIWNYSYDTWGEAKADAYLMAIDAKFRTIEENPKIGRRRPDIKPGYYSIRAIKHVVFYVLDGQYINIIGVIHERMDHRRKLAGVEK